MVGDLNLDNLSVDDSGRASFSGLSSGIDSKGTVDAIMAARRIPIDTLETKVETNDEKITSLQTLKIGLEALSSSLSKLYGQVSFGSSNDIFSAKQAFASSSRIDGTTASTAGNILGATVGQSAAASSHTIDVLQIAKAHKISSTNITSPTTALGFGNSDQFTITSDETRTSFNSSVATDDTVVLGTSGTLTFTDDTGETIGTVNYSATDTISDLADLITTNITGVTGEITTVSGGARLALTSSSEFRMAESGAGTVLTDFELGVRKIDVSSSTTLYDLRDLINQANIGTNATGVNASVITVSASESYLVLTTDNTGVTMTLSEESGTLLQTVGLLTSGGAIENELQAAQVARLYADGILDQTNTSYESGYQTAATSTVGSTGELSFTLDSDSSSLGTVTYNSTDSLTTIAANITSSITGVTATIVTDGAGVRLEISGASAFSFTESSAGSAITDLDIDNKRRAIERSSNTIDDLYNGVTLTLYAAEPGTTITLDIEQDLSQVKAEIVNFVDAYNVLRQFINEQRQVDGSSGEQSDESGVLFNSTALNEVSRILSNILGQGTSGVDASYSVLSQIGIDFIDRGQADPLFEENLEIDNTKLDEVLQSNPDDVRRLFTFDFTSSDPRVTLLSFDGDTTYDSSGYTLNLQPSTSTNLFQYSEQADNAYWTAVASTISANAIVAPDGTTTADGLIGDATNATHYLQNTAGETLTAGETYLFSTYAKKGDNDNASLILSGAAFASSIQVDFDLNAGTITSTGNLAEDASIEDVGDGWYRITVKATATASSTATFEQHSKSTGSTYTGDTATVNTYFWGAQLETTTATTTLSDTGFTPTRSTISADVVAPLAPDGTATADGIVSSIDNDTHSISSTSTISVTAGETYDFTAFVQAGAQSKVQLSLPGSGFASNVTADFDLSGGTVTATGTGSDSATIEDIGSGWYKVTLTATASSNGTVNLDLYSMSAATGTTFTGDAATVDTYFADMRLVPSTSPGTYRPTTDAAVTSGAATANINGAADGASDGSASIDGSVMTVDTGGADGMILYFSGLDYTAALQLDFTVGVGAQMFFAISNLLDTTTGIVEGEIDQLTDQNKVNTDRIEEKLDRLEIQRQSLMERYISMEIAIATANRIMDSIRQTMGALLNQDR
jgi:flagellar capping protein FliD